MRVTLDGPAVVGRSSSAALQLIDGKVSREHCRFLVDGGRVSVEDLGSQNGTFVNGVAVSGARVLAPGDEIAVGDSLLLLDPDFAVLAARFGDATLVLSDAAGDVDVDVAPVVATPSGATQRPSSDIAPDTARATIARLARALASASGGEAAVEALLDAAGSCLPFERAFVLAVARGAPDSAAGAGAVRVLGGRARDRVGGAGPGAPAAGGSSGAVEETLVMARPVLASAARRGAPIALLSPVHGHTRGGARTVVTSARRASLVAPLVAGGAAPTSGFLYLDRSADRPWSAADLSLADALASVAALSRLGGVLAPAGPPETAAPALDAPIGISPAFARVRELAAAAARTTSTVLITGESGTGKEEIARHIHRLSGRGPFIAVNCGAIPEALAESELFGHERGAFTGAVAAREGRIEAADGGTLFLDEVGELSPAVQVKLLRVLQERVFQRVGSTTTRSVDLRVVAATHRQLEAEVAAGRFREDLYYRLNVLRVAIPPLRERRGDVAPLAAALLARVALRVGCRDPGLTPDAGELLAGGRWPGNARELGNVLERALVLRAPAARGKVAALERAEILAALRAARGVKARAAKQLGISRPTLDKKMTDLAIDLWNADDQGGGGA